jgi:Ca2+:H+ antiporter
MVLVAAFTLPMGAPLGTVCAIALLGAVMAAVHHAEVIAHRVGEPFGTLVLALAVTVIEVALIVSMMVAGGADQAALARDTIFSTVMIVANGVIGLCLVAGSLHHHEQGFRIPGAHTSLATLIAMCTLTLVLPTFTTTTPGPTYAVSQLAFAAAMSLVLWLAFVFVQTVRHRDYFLPEVGASDPEQHAQPPSQRETALSAGLLAVSLVAVVGLAKALSPAIESGLDAMGAPPAVLGIAIALLVLLPETVASIRAAAADRLQTSLNLAYGSALASIGLTIPAVAAASVLMGIPLVLGLAAKDLVLLLLTVFVSILTLSSGRTHLMPGVLHLVIFAAFLFLALVP